VRGDPTRRGDVRGGGGKDILFGVPRGRCKHNCAQAHHQLPVSPMGLFQACMRRRLPEMAAEYLKNALPPSEAGKADLRRYTADAALPLMKESEWFDWLRFWDLMGFPRP
jgi:hypothetical protein